MHRKNIPNKLQEQQEFKKQESINRVLRAIKDLKDENKKVTISNLVEFTGLSRSVFSKPHIRDLLVDYGYSLNNSSGNFKVNKNKPSEKDRIIADLRVKNAELEKECALLRGRLFLVMERNL